jgi:glycosyltransferase involved in cell wall biosynthesis
MKIKKKIKYSFILPIYNPPPSIEEALKCLQNISYRSFELIIIDDSEVTNKKMLIKFKKIKNFIYFKRNKSNGLDGAFNYGIRRANGEIVIMYTDDNLVKKNFLNKIDKHYKNGFDFVIVRSYVKNYNNLFAIHQSSYENRNYNNPSYAPNWSEGFSVKKKCIKNIGLYPDLGNVSGGNDNLLSVRLQKKFRIKRDFSIKMPHLGPSSFKEFYFQQIQRGMAGPQSYYHLTKSKFYVFLKYSIKVIINIIIVSTQIFIIQDSISLVKYAKKKSILSFIKIYIASNLKKIFNILGEIKSTYQL